MRLRFASLRDAEQVAAIYMPIVETMAISFELISPDAAEMRKRIGLQPGTSRGSSPRSTARFGAAGCDYG
jgi:L-amino acid N-acyltransferase YncA